MGICCGGPLADSPVPRLSKVISLAKRPRRGAERLLPHHLDVRHPAGAEEQVAWTGAGDLICHIDVTALGVARLGRHRRTYSTERAAAGPLSDLRRSGIRGAALR